MDGWSWQEDGYRLDSESPLVISQSFWQDLSPTEATSRSLFASASPPERVQAQPFPFGLPTADADLCPESVAGALRGTSRTKRRRMLCFPGTKAELGCESQCGSGMNEGYTVAEEYEASTWFLRSGPDEDSGAPCCDKWVDRCLGDTRDACDRTRNVLDDSAHSQHQLSFHHRSDSQETCCQQHHQPHGTISMNEGQDSVEVSQGSYQQQLRECKESRESDDVAGLHKKVELLPLDRPSGNESQDCFSPTAEAGSESEAVLGPVTPLSSRPSTAAAGAGRSRKSKPMAAPAAAVAVAYPFAVLKPSGAQGDVTLNDINRRISSSPCSAGGAAPRKRKKGSSSSSSSSGGPPGPTGRAVVALTKIHTEGKGTITIVRTRAPF